MTTSQKLHRLAAALFVGGLLLFLTSAFTAWNGVWVLSILFIIAALWLTAWVDLRDADAAHRALIDELTRD